MRKVGEYIRDARLKKRLSKEELGEATKIRQSFIDAIEKENWEKLPAFPVVLGFVKSISHFLDIDERETIAILRRDYPIKPVVVNPKPDIETKLVWSPRKTFLVGVGVIVLLITGYLGFQYRKFQSSPNLKVSEPTEGQIVKVGEVHVAGTTDPDVTIKINNQPALVSDQGEFGENIEVDKNTTTIIIEALSRSGKMTTINRRIQVVLK